MNREGVNLYAMELNKCCFGLAQFTLQVMRRNYFFNCFDRNEVIGLIVV